MKKDKGSENIEQGPNLNQARRGVIHNQDELEYGLGRKLKLRIHLAVMILQMLFKWAVVRILSHRKGSRGYFIQEFEAYFASELKEEIRNKFKVNHEEVSAVYFYGKECCVGKKERGFQGVSYFGKIRAESIYSISFSFANRFCGKSSLELSGQSKFAHQRRLEIPSGRRAFCQDGNNQVRKDSFAGDERCSLCSEGEGGERQGVWASFSTGKNRRKFFDSLSLHFTENERQRMSARYYHGAWCDIRREGTGVGDDRQGVLLPGKHKICRGDDGQCRRSSTTGECQESGRGPPERGIIQQKSRSGTTNRTCKTIWIKKKQNEIRRGNALVRIPICHGIQSPSINKVPRVKRVAPDGLGDSTK